MQKGLWSQEASHADTFPGIAFFINYAKLCVACLQKYIE